LKVSVDFIAELRALPSNIEGRPDVGSITRAGFTKDGETIEARNWQELADKLEAQQN
jgi:hypothetical protein